MYHVPDDSEYEITSKLDFIVPLKQVGLITRAVLEAIHTFYRPRRIIIISSKNEASIVRSLSPHWDAGVIEFVDEETFFERNYNLTIQQILSQYDANREGDQREPGWWIQQLIKLGAASQIPNISTHYVVWDGDLVPTRRWKLGYRDRNGAVKYYIAILQAEARSEFNSYQYAMCMKALTGETPRDPQGGGTFVAHHMVFNKHYVNEMLSFMNAFTGSALPWPLLIMSYSRKFYRFSEYKTYATYMLNRHPTEFHYHPLSDYGEGGLRFRDANRIVEQILASCPLSKGGLSYGQIVTFAKENMAEFQGPISTAQEVRLEHSVVPGYIQLDHVYGIAKLGLDPEDLPVFTASASRGHTPRSSITSASGLALTDLISAACASAMAAAADDLNGGGDSLVFDLVNPAGECFTGVAPMPLVLHDPSSNISSMTASAEFKVTRLRVNTRVKNPTRGAKPTLARAASPVSPSVKIAAAKVSSRATARSCPAPSTGFLVSLGGGVSVGVGVAAGLCHSGLVSSSMYLQESKEEALQSFPVMAVPNDMGGCNVVSALNCIQQV